MSGYPDFTPTVEGFQQFFYTTTGTTANDIPTNSVFWNYAFYVACDIVLQWLACMSPHIYMLAVYNLASDNLINWAPDNANGTPPSTFFSTTRKNYNINSAFVAGTISASSDNGTSQSIATIESLKDITIGQLQNLKTPYGRQYLAFAAEFGTVWGLT